MQVVSPFPFLLEVGSPLNQLGVRESAASCEKATGGNHFEYSVTYREYHDGVAQREAVAGSTPSKSTTVIDKYLATR